MRPIGRNLELAVEPPTEPTFPGPPSLLASALYSQFASLGFSYPLIAGIVAKQVGVERKSADYNTN